MAINQPRQFELQRTPLYPSPHDSYVFMMPDPGSATKTVTVSDKRELAAEMAAFGRELDRWCRVSQKHLGRGLGFLKLPHQIACCEDKPVSQEDGRRLQDEYLAQMRGEG